jgi:hypothetical protein
MDKALGGVLSEVLAAGGFEGKQGQATRAVRVLGAKAAHVALVGLGKKDKAAAVADWGPSAYQVGDWDAMGCSGGCCEQRLWIVPLAAARRGAKRHPQRSFAANAESENPAGRRRRGRDPLQGQQAQVRRPRAAGAAGAGRGGGAAHRGGRAAGGVRDDPVRFGGCFFLHCVAARVVWVGACLDWKGR